MSECLLLLPPVSSHCFLNENVGNVTDTNDQMRCAVRLRACRRDMGGALVIEGVVLRPILGQTRIMVFVCCGIARVVFLPRRVGHRRVGAVLGLRNEYGLWYACFEPIVPRWVDEGTPPL